VKDVTRIGYRDRIHGRLGARKGREKVKKNKKKANQAKHP
jgi:hypothetical protein